MKRKILAWIARLIIILVILFMVLMSADCFDGSYSAGEKFTCFIMHNIPAFLIILVLAASWIQPLLGGVLFMILSVATAFFFQSFTGNYWSLLVVVPLFVSGILFVLSSSRKNTSGKQEE